MRATSGRVTAALLLLAPAGMLLLPGGARAQSLAQDIAPTTLSADLDGGRALFVNPALMATDPSPRWDLTAAWERDVLRRGLLGITGQGVHLGYRYDSGPTPPMSELRLGGAFGSPSGGVGYALRFQHESVWGPGAGATTDLGMFIRPNENSSVSWVLRNAGNKDGFEHRHQLIGLSLRPSGSKYTLGGDVRWDDGGYRTNLYRVGVRAQLGSSVELSGTYQPPRLGGSAEVHLGLALVQPHLDVRAAHRLQSGDRGSGTWIGISGRTAVPRGGAGLSRARTVAVDVAGPLREERPAFSLLGGGGRSVQDALALLRQAEEDPSVRGVLLRVGELGRGLLGPLTAESDELRDGVLRLRRAGKPVVAYLGSEIVGSQELYVASACDRIVAPRLAAVGGLGVAVEVRRLKGTFEKLGIRWEHAEEGAYKSTFHSYYTDTTSEAQREELQSLVHTAYEQLVRALATGRNLPADSVRALCDGRALTAPEAVASGLIDAVGWQEQAQDVLGRLCGFQHPVTAKALHPEATEPERWGVPPTVALVTAEGTIVQGHEVPDYLLGNTSLGSATFAERLKRAARLPGVRAVVLRINSGGGSALASDRMRDAVEKVRSERHIPVIVSMGGMAASGGYMIAAPADRIYADSMTVTGSIGVVWFLADLSGVYEKLGARRDVFKEGEHSDVGLMGRALTDDERRQLNHLVDDTYDQFLGVVAAGRHLGMDQVRKAAQGRLWWGVQAKDLGLVDRLGTLRDALDGAARMAGLPRDYAVVRVGARRGGLLERLLSAPLSGLASRFSGAADAGAGDPD